MIRYSCLGTSVCRPGLLSNVIASSCGFSGFILLREGARAGRVCRAGPARAAKPRRPDTSALATGSCAQSPRENTPALPRPCSPPGPSSPRAVRPSQRRPCFLPVFSHGLRKSHHKNVVFFSSCSSQIRRTPGLTPDGLQAGVCSVQVPIRDWSRPGPFPASPGRNRSWASRPRNLRCWSLGQVGREAVTYTPLLMSCVSHQCFRG